MRQWKNGWKKVSVLFALAVFAVSSMCFSTATKAEVKDESTFDSAVRGTNETFYRTIATNYHAGNILGMVSKSTAAQMEEATRITQDDKKKGYEPVLYINSFDWNSDERKAADQVAQDMNGTLVAMLDVQLFRYEVSAFAPVHDAAKKVTLIAGIPDKSSKDGNEYSVIVDYEEREFAMVRVHNGQITVLKDLDSDPKTITFETDKFSAYGLMYAPAGAIDQYLKDHPSVKPTGTSKSSSAGTGKNTGAGELDDVPKTGDILWEMEYGFCKYMPR